MIAAAEGAADLCLLGGAFDPPHRTHERIARAALAQLPIRRLLVVPAGRHPHKQSSVRAPADVRLELCRLAFAGIPSVEVDDYELRQADPCYTVDTVQHFRECATAGRRPWWLIGSDNLPLLPTWHRFHDLLRRAVLATYPRAGMPVAEALRAARGLTAAERDQLAARVLDAPPDDLSSSTIRVRLARGEDASAWLHPAVAARIQELGLYRDPDA